jgi:hypothetical protein
MNAGDCHLIPVDLMFLYWMTGEFSAAYNLANDWDIKFYLEVRWTDLQDECLPFPFRVDQGVYILGLRMGERGGGLEALDALEAYIIT